MLSLPVSNQFLVLATKTKLCCLEDVNRKVVKMIELISLTLPP